MKKEKILVVDDNDDHREAIQFILEKEGYYVIPAQNGVIGLRQLKKHNDIRVLIVDLEMVKLSGVDLLKQIKQREYPLRRIVLTAHEEQLPFREAKELDVFSYLNKPISKQAVLFTVKSAFKDLYLKKLEKELGIAKQWEELGQITEGFVNFVVNKVGIIPNHIETIIEELKGVTKSVQSKFDQIYDIIDEIIELKRVLSTPFARPEKEKVNVVEIIELTIDLIPIPEEIKIISNYGSKELFVYSNSIDLQKVLEAVIVNAIDAMKDVDKKELTISTSESSNETVQITICDTGCGIPEEKKNKIFRAFYTTKKGMNFGLGLFLAKNTLAKFDGTIKFHSNKEEGTSFVINLPLLKKRI
jgi:CheY-like chemotaxis protein